MWACSLLFLGWLTVHMKARWSSWNVCNFTSGHALIYHKSVSCLSFLLEILKELTNDANQIWKPVRFTRVQNYKKIYLGSVPAQYLWDLWHTELHCDTLFLRIVWFSPLFHSTNAPYSFIHPSPVPYKLSNWQHHFERRPLRRDLRCCQRCSSGFGSWHEPLTRNHTATCRRTESPGKLTHICVPCEWKWDSKLPAWFTLINA